MKNKYEAKPIFNGVVECCHVVGGVAFGGVSVFWCGRFCRGSSELTEAFC